MNRRTYPRVLLVWASSAVCVTGSLGEGLLVDGVLALGWLSFLLAVAEERARARALFAAASGGAIAAVWVLAARAYPTVLIGSALAVAVAIGLVPRPRRAFIAFAVALVPLVPALIAYGVGGEDARAAVTGDFRLPVASFGVLAGYGEALSVVVAGVLVLFAARHRGVLAGAVAILALLVVVRSITLASYAVLPGDAHWSEPPILLNLLKLRLGAPFYGPLTSCNSYSYSPALETVHHALLAPLGLDLSLLANRALVFLWHSLTLLVLVVALRPFVQCAEASRRVRFATHAFVALALGLIVTSSFLASNLHPDHLLMMFFALALALALRGERLPPKIFYAGIVVVPALCTSVKLTGAGVGLGIALAFVWPLRRGKLLALGVAAGAAGLVLVVSERLFPGFWEYTYRLQASHPIDWSAWPRLFSEPPGRLAIVAVIALLGMRFGGEHEELVAARADALRVMLVTCGFALPSAIAYLKVGGRVNSLLPLAIGSAVALARLAAGLARSHRSWAAIAGVLSVWAALEVLPHDGPVDAHDAELVRRRHEEAVALTQRERASGHRVLFYESTEIWLDSGIASEVPRDRAQVMNELLLGNHHEVDACFGRLEDGTYDTLVLTGRATRSLVDRLLAPRLTSILAAHYEAIPIEPPFAEPPSISAPPPVVYRWRR